MFFISSQNEHYKRPSVKLVSLSDLAFVSLALPISGTSYGHLENESERCCSQPPHTDAPFWMIKSMYLTAMV